MNILFLCHHFPYPPDHGARIRAFHFIRHLSQTNSVTVATLAHTQQELIQGQGLKEYCHRVIAEVIPSRVRWGRALRALYSSTPSSVSYFRSVSLQRQIDDLLASENFDAIIVFCAFMAQYVVAWRGGYRILDYGDIDSAKWRDYSRYKAIPLSWAYAWEAAKLRNYERRIARHFHHCAVISRGELEEFQRFETGVPCAIIPNGVDTEYFVYDKRNTNGGSTIVFLGRMDYFPNVDGISYFVKEIFPLIRQKLPRVELCIVGSDPTKSVRDLVRVPNVSLTGYVPDVRCYLRNAAVSIAPLRIARGTQNKILEAMAMGIPTVATPEAAKGIQGVPGRDFLVAADPKSFANEVIQIIENAPLRKTLAESGRFQIEQVHTWDSSVAILDTVLNKMPKPIEMLTAQPGSGRNCERYLPVP
jgi:sugar transferase (PEP-CTERM/EpsH1 system associated)